MSWLANIHNRDNAVDLYLGLYKPDPALHGPGPYPTIVAVYGGPHVQRVSKSWATTVDMRAQRLRDLGFAVVKSDNRGSFRRGLAFEGWIKHNMGSIEVRDQVSLCRAPAQPTCTCCQCLSLNACRVCLLAHPVSSHPCLRVRFHHLFHVCFIGGRGASPCA
jgi:Prolyl oligopeptidase family